MYQNDPLKVLTGEVRLSYAHLSEPYANPQQPNAKAKYSVTLLIPKIDFATKADIDAAIQAAVQEATGKTWGGVRPPQIRIPIHDGDGPRQSGEPYGDECKGHWVMTANSLNKPQVVDQSNIQCELAPQDIYSGMYARVTLRFFGYSNSGNRGIGCGLGNVMKTRDGEPLSGGASAAADFAGIGQMIDGATPQYGAPVPVAPQQYGAPAPAAPPQYGTPVPATSPQWTTPGIDPITGQPNNYPDYPF